MRGAPWSADRAFWRRNGTDVALAILLSASAVAPLAAQVPDVYERRETTFDVDGKKIKGYEVRARIRFPFSVVQVLDASHDHVHLSELDRDVERESVTRTRCTQQICRINVDVVVGSFFLVGEITYELDTNIQENDDGSIRIEWRKTAGTRFVKHLRGVLLLVPEGENATAVDYHLQVAAPRLSPDKLGAKAEAYLARLETVLEERHEGHPSIWQEMKEGG